MVYNLIQTIFDAFFKKKSCSPLLIITVIFLESMCFYTLRLNESFLPTSTISSTNLTEPLVVTESGLNITTDTLQINSDYSSSTLSYRDNQGTQIASNTSLNYNTGLCKNNIPFYTHQNEYTTNYGSVETFYRDGKILKHYETITQPESQSDLLSSIKVHPVVNDHFNKDCRETTKQHNEATAHVKNSFTKKTRIVLNGKQNVSSQIIPIVRRSSCASYTVGYRRSCNVTDHSHHPILKPKLQYVVQEDCTKVISSTSSRSFVNENQSTRERFVTPSHLALLVLVETLRDTMEDQNYKQRGWKQVNYALNVLEQNHIGSISPAHMIKLALCHCQPSAGRNIIQAIIISGNVMAMTHKIINAFWKAVFRRYKNAFVQFVDKQFNNVLHLAVLSENPRIIRHVFQRVTNYQNLSCACTDVLNMLNSKNIDGYTPQGLTFKITSPTVAYGIRTELKTLHHMSQFFCKCWKGRMAYA